MTNIMHKIVAALAGGCITAFFVLAPVIVVRCELSRLFARWQEAAFYLICIAGGAAAGALGLALTAGSQELKRQRVVVWGSAIFFLLYLSCSVLCEKIHFGTADNGLWRTAGLLLLASGGTIWLCRGHYCWIRHPSHLGVIISSVGIPMIFGTWFPLLAIPGLIVAIKWRILLESQDAK